MSAQLLHRVDLFEEGTLAGARAVCLAPDTAACRQWCAEGCEEYCSADEILLSGVDVELVAQAPLAGHRWAPIGSCREADWINACGVEDCCADDEALRFDVDGDGVLRPAVRSGYIETEWTGDDYVWSYADLPPTDTAVAPAPTADAPALFEVSA